MARQVSPLPAPRVARGLPTRFDELRRASYVQMIRMGARRVKAAELIGVSYTTVRYHLERDEAFRAEVETAEEARIDEVEEALYAAAINGNVAAQQVVLYNRRSQDWADQRRLFAKLEAAATTAAEARGGDVADARRALQGKLESLRARLAPAPETAESA